MGGRLFRSAKSLKKKKLDTTKQFNSDEKGKKEEKNYFCKMANCMRTLNEGYETITIAGKKRKKNRLDISSTRERKKKENETRNETKQTTKIYISRMFERKETKWTFILIPWNPKFKPNQLT